MSNCLDLQKPDGSRSFFGITVKFTEVISLLTIIVPQNGAAITRSNRGCPSLLRES